MDQTLNLTLTDMVGSASFLLTAIALLVSAVAISVGAWANYRAKRFEADTARMELSYRLLIASAGGGDALLPSGATHYSNLQVQTVALASLRAFPEYLDVYERLLADKQRQLATKADFSSMTNQEYNTVLKSELMSLITAVKRTKSNRRPWDIG